MNLIGSNRPEPVLATLEMQTLIVMTTPALYHPFLVTERGSENWRPRDE